MPGKGTIGLLGAVSIGIGGMVGAGIFSILGVAAESAGTGLWLSFLIGGAVALLSTYSYAKLGAKYPSAGGAVEFLTRGFGEGALSGGINLFMWVGYIIAIALYANAFAGYFGTFVPGDNPKIAAVGAIAAFMGVNWLGSALAAKSESVIVGIKIGILILFAIGGLFYMQPSRLDPALMPALPGLVAGAGIIFMGYEGFGLVANSAGAMADPQRTLPRALYISVISVIVIYLAVSVAVLGNLSVPEMVEKKDYALAVAARPFMGEFGFRLVAVAAVLSTASAINATLFVASNVAKQVAGDGQMPGIFAQRHWALLATGALSALFAAAFDLSGIAMMGSAAFLLIYAAVNAAHLRLVAETGARRPIIGLAILGCLAIFGFLAEYTYRTQPAAIYAMIGLGVACGAVAWVYARIPRKA